MLKLRGGTSTLLVGPSRAGKTSLVRRIIAENMYDPPIRNVIWSYKVFQPWFVEEKNFCFIRGLPDSTQEGDLLVIDDCLYNLSQEIAEYFTVHSHHGNMNIILILQNLFPKSKFARDISLNAQYIILFKNPRDASQIQTFARQIFPRGNGKFLVDAYIKSTSKAYGYLIIDLCPDTPEQFRVRESIFPDDHGHTYIYVPEK